MTLRTPAAFEATRAMRGVEGAIVGAGTVTNPDELERVLDAGSEFYRLARADRAARSGGARRRVPFLPGVANAGDHGRK